MRTITIRPDGLQLTLTLFIRQFSRRSLLVCCALAPILSGCSKPQPPPAFGPQEVLVTKVIQQDVPVVKEWIATLDGSVNADIRARVSGYLISQNYKEGTFVHQGELLFQIDPSTYEAAVEQAKSSLAQSQANQLQADQSARRETQLFEQKVESAQSRDNAVQANIAAQAEVKAQQAALRQAELNLQFTKITAPVSGIAGIANPGIGDLVGPERCSAPCYHVDGQPDQGLPENQRAGLSQICEKS